MWPRSSIPRVITMLRYTPRRSSRSSPASLTSLSELTGSASRATAMRSRTVTIGEAVAGRPPLKSERDGGGIRLAPRGAPQDARRLGHLLPRLRPRSALFRRERGRAPAHLPDLRRRDATPLPRLRSAVQLGLRRRVRGVRLRAPLSRAVRHAHPPPRLILDVGEMDDRDGVRLGHRPVVELSEEGGHLLSPADLGVVLLELPRRTLAERLHLDLVDDRVEDLLARPVPQPGEHLDDHSLLVLTGLVAEANRRGLAPRAQLVGDDR